MESIIILGVHFSEK